MIRSLTINNVQSHKDTHLKFHKGVNMIIGKSDHGKSAIFNALYKLFYNRPAGDEWRSWWGGESLIKVLIEDFYVTYTKDKVAEYTLVPHKREPLIFKAFGRKVPEEITTALNLNKKINIQEQLERGVPIFLIAESPGDVAKHFNDVAGLGKIDSTIKAAKDDIKETKKKDDYISDQLKNREKELKRYENLKELNKLVKTAEKHIKKVKGYKAKQDTLKQEILGTEAAWIRISAINYILKIKKYLKKATVLHKKIRKSKKQKDRIRNHLNAIQGFTEELEEIEDALQYKDLVNKALNQNIALQHDKKKKLELKNEVSWLLNTQYKIKETTNTIKRKRTKLKGIWPDVCPLCGSEQK